MKHTTLSIFVDGVNVIHSQKVIDTYKFSLYLICRHAKHHISKSGLLFLTMEGLLIQTIASFLLLILYASIFDHSYKNIGMFYILYGLSFFKSILEGIY